MSIRISKKYGVNPMIPVCFWCGKEKNEIALLGRLKGDAEAPRGAVLDCRPCDNCEEEMGKGITMMEASTKPTFDNFPAMQEGVYPTGRFLIMTEDGAKKIILGEEALKSALRTRKCFVEKDIFEFMLDASSVSEE